MNPYHRLDISFAGLALLTLLVNIPYFSGQFFPIHDTAQTFQGFHYFYSHYFFYNEIPKWNMYGTFGSPNVHYQLVFLTPSSYAAMLAGKITGVTDVLFLFKLSIFIDQIVSLTGPSYSLYVPVP